MRRQLRDLLFVVIPIALVGCAPDVREADIEATVSARVSLTLSAVLSSESTSVPAEDRPVETPAAIPPGDGPVMVEEQIGAHGELGHGV